MISLPLPNTLLAAIKDEPRQPERINTDLSNHIGGLSIDANRIDRNLPSIKSILNNTPPPERRPSDSSTLSYTSSSSIPHLPQFDSSRNPNEHAWINEPWASTVCTNCGDNLRGAPDEEVGLCSACAHSTPKSPQQNSAPRRPQQINDHVHFPYPTPLNSPVQASKRVSQSCPIRRSPRHYRYNESSDSMAVRHSTHSPECSDMSENEKPKNNSKKPRNKKAQREFYGRQKQSGSLASVQNALLEVNPNMAVLAAPRPDVPNGGWRPLKSNNINKDIENPLFVNKVDVMATSTTVIRQDNMVFAQAIERLRQMGDTVVRAGDRLRAAGLEDLVDELGLYEFADELAEVMSNRGCIGFRFLTECMQKHRF